MKKPSEIVDKRELLRKSIIGLGERSIRKSYYPELQQRIQELEQSNRDLQTEIVERQEAQKSQRKLERQLEQSQKMEAIGTLAGGIAHDFNNILSAILGYTELAQLKIKEDHELSDSVIFDDLEQVKHAGNRARELVLQILTFSRQQDYERVPLEIEPVIKEALKLLRSSLPQSIEIREKYEKTTRLIQANSTQIHQIIMNLATNAHHAMPKSVGIIGVEVKQIEIHIDDPKSDNLQLQPGPYTLISISDNGCGMEKAVLNKIFDPYFTTKSRDEGTGMGLAMVHGIMKSHGGHISGYSEPGQGTTFHLYLPQIETLPHDTDLQNMNQIPRGDESILHIDDEPTVARMQHRVLESLGYKVTTYNDPLDALKFYTAHPNDCDLIITDMTMPGMNGSKVTQEFIKLNPKAKVIICTGFSELLNEQSAISIGAKSFVMKPLIRTVIARLVRETLDK